MLFLWTFYSSRNPGGKVPVSTKIQIKMQHIFFLITTYSVCIIIMQVDILIFLSKHILLNSNHINLNNYYEFCISFIWDALLLTRAGREKPWIQMCILIKQGFFYK